MNETLYGDNLVLMSESMENLRAKGLKVNLKKTKVMVSG